MHFVALFVGHPSHPQLRDVSAHSEAQYKRSAQYPLRGGGYFVDRFSWRSYQAQPAVPLIGTTGGWRVGRACPLCPGISDINLFRYCEGVIDLDAEISDRAFDLGMPEQELDSPQVARPPIDQGSFCTSQRMRPK